MQKLRWSVVRSQLPRPHVVYYNVNLPDGRRAAVARIYSDHGSTWDPKGPWRWVIYKKRKSTMDRWEPEQEGTALNAPLAKFAVREATGEYIASR